MSKEAMRLALDALEEINKLSIGANAVCLPAEIDTAMDALREALAEQPAQQGCMRCNTPKKCALYGCSPLTWPSEQPSQRTWVGLTDEERNHARQSVTYSQLAMTVSEWTEAVQIETERRLREKNNA